jgi:hypothetical protein
MRQDMPAIATRLGVEEPALRMSLDASAPYPTSEVLLAVIRYFGVDPGWLLTGEYSRETHAEAVAADERGSEENLRRLLGALSYPSLGPPLTPSEPTRITASEK